MLAIIDYGVGNLFSLRASLHYIGTDTVVTNRKEDIKKADKLILPGVGAFEDAIAKLRDTGLVDTIVEETGKGKYLLGICLGMQLLFDRSCEYGEHAGFGLIKGEIASIKNDLSSKAGGKLNVPHIGWNALKVTGRGIGEDASKDKLFKYTSDGDCVYFVHSYYGKNCRGNTIATAEYGITITAAVRNGTVYGTQFHPEKSGTAGLGILKAFTEI